MKRSLGLFEGTGVEIEYMICDKSSLSVKPISDQLLFELAGAEESEVELGALAASNELVLHVVELKTNGPAKTLSGLGAVFHDGVQNLNQRLAKHNACLMPTAMHPLMDPYTETRLWPHEQSEIYELFDAIFDCRGHGWSNLQSVHINLPFTDDDEFRRLHAAIRLVLPLLPALAASSPLVEGKLTGVSDNRLNYYRNNCRRLPVVTGAIIPESCLSESDYRERILLPIVEATRAFDQANVFDPEWVNARGAIARFSRGSIEIRVIDVQECPSADLAVVAAAVALVKSLVYERWVSFESQASWDENRLLKVLVDCIEHGGAAKIDDTEYRKLLCAESAPDARAIWKTLLEQAESHGDLGGGPENRVLKAMIEQPTLAERISFALPKAPEPASIREIYAELCRCLARDELFVPVQ